MKNKRIAIYSRKSKFVEGSESIENQIEMCKDYINRHLKNAEILIYEDEGYSGGNTERPKFKKLLDDVTKNKFNILICYRLDRISRNVGDFSNIITLLQENNIEFISIREQFDTTTPMGRAMMYVSSVFAQLERETIAERIADNMLELSRTGRWLGGRPPLGYTNVGKGANIELHEDTVLLQLVKDLYDKYLELGSLTQVQTWSIHKDIKTRDGKFFDVSSIANILRNPVYCIGDIDFYNYAKNNKMIICNSLSEFETNDNRGIMVYNKTNQRSKKRTVKRALNEWIVALGQHRGIIQASMWLQVQEMIKNNSVKSPRTETSKMALLSTFLRCKNCGSTFRIQYKYVDGEIRQYYYKCRGKEKSRGLLCNIKNINGYEADEQILKQLIVIGSDDALIEDLFKQQEASLNSNDIIENITSIEKQINKIEVNIEKLTEKLIDVEGSSASKYIVAKIEKLDTEMKELQNKIYEQQQELEDTNTKQLNVDLFKETIKYLKENIDILTVDEKKQILKRLVTTIYWDGEDLELKIF